MNNFTKEELIQISISCSYGRTSMECEQSDLIQKLYKMIANYCKHERYEENIVTGIVCSQCGEPWNE